MDQADAELAPGFVRSRISTTTLRGTTASHDAAAAAAADDDDDDDNDDLVGIQGQDEPFKTYHKEEEGKKHYQQQEKEGDGDGDGDKSGEDDRGSDGDSGGDEGDDDSEEDEEQPPVVRNNNSNTTTASLNPYRAPIARPSTIRTGSCVTFATADWLMLGPRGFTVEDMPVTRQTAAAQAAVAGARVAATQNMSEEVEYLIALHVLGREETKQKET
ncbi:hypothetical protein N0V93_010301 [Gnomoniopsis smithogilvyi]|uniref:Uncharacterized protein n=1 Tax=Gnomoniopsis smithogilvyi TaxID=1191159 RepID=A0A9W8YIC6_9PEZI|nr:hypothetical protein N0V93_010301 [Gnomoniopsis smithogilvyi]